MAQRFRVLAEYVGLVPSRVAHHRPYYSPRRSLFRTSRSLGTCVLHIHRRTFTRPFNQLECPGDILQSRQLVKPGLKHSKYVN